ncbi:MAG: hypothetical protein LBD35_03200 [Prevotellaceae bacterium]|jgi:hypothetical protein|nr:hypothetical protein [Prevotellaceae bacterium]
MKQYFILMTICTFSILFSGCGKKEKTPDDRITVDKTELNFTAGVTSLEFNIETAVEWHVDAAGIEHAFGVDAAIVNDFTVAPSSGTGNAKVTVTLNNRELTESYEIELKIIAGKNTETVKLKAAAN